MSISENIPIEARTSNGSVAKTNKLFDGTYPDYPVEEIPGRGVHP